MNNQRHTRSDLINLAILNEGKILEFTAYFLEKRDELWLTFSQLKMKGENKILASHFNLPIHKIEGGFNFTQLQKNVQVNIQAIPGFYLKAGTKRGCLLGFGQQQLIKLEVVEKEKL